MYWAKKNTISIIKLWKILNESMINYYFVIYFCWVEEIKKFPTINISQGVQYLTYFCIMFGGKPTKCVLVGAHTKQMFLLYCT